MSQSGSPQLEALGKVFSDLPDSVFLVEADAGKILYANVKALDQTGLSKDEVKSLSFEALFSSADPQSVRTLFEKARSGASGVASFQLKRKKGESLAVELHASRIAIGDSSAMYCALRDVTQRVELEERVKATAAELANAVKEFEDVMNNIEQGILTIGPDLRFNSEYSSVARELFGKEEIAGADVRGFFFGADPGKPGERMTDWLKYNFQSPQHWELSGPLGLKDLEYVRPDEAKRIIELSWKPIFSGKEDGQGEEALKMTKIMVICVDVTEQRRMEHELAVNEEKHREELELISNMISLSTDTVSRFARDFQSGMSVIQEQLIMAGSYSGLAVEDLKSFQRFLHTLKGNARQMRLKGLEMEVHRLEGILEKKDVDLTVLLESIDRLSGISGRVTTTCERVLGQIDAMNAGDDDAHILSNVIMPGALPRLSEFLDKAISGPGWYPLETARQAASWMAQVPVQQLFRRVEALAEELSKDLGRPIKIEKEGAAIRIEPDTLGLLYDALLHLIRNSADHGGDSVAQRRAQGKSDALTIRLSVREIDQEIEIEIADDGRGMDPAVIRGRALLLGVLPKDRIERATDSEVLDLVFLPGFSTRDKATHLSGRGVGMDAVKELVERSLEGRVSLDSEVGKGTTITLRFPRTQTMIPPAPAAVIIPDGDSRVDWDTLLGVPLKNVAESVHWYCEARHYDTLRAANRGLTAVVVGESSPAESAGFLEVHPEIKHYGDMRNRYLGSFLRTTHAKLSGNGHFGLEPYLWPTATIRSHLLRRTHDRREFVDRAVDFGNRLKLPSSVVTAVAVVAEELLTNACFDAPRDQKGALKYHSRDRAEEFVLDPSEHVRFRFGADPNFIGVSIEDPFGSLDLTSIKKHLAKGFRRGNDPTRAEVGAGRGIFKVFENAHFMIVNRKPGVKTEIIGLIGLGKNNRDYQSAGRCFSFFEL